jgi:hypothetical protein
MDIKDVAGLGFCADKAGLDLLRWGWPLLLCLRLWVQNVVKRCYWALLSPWDREEGGGEQWIIFASKKVICEEKKHNQSIILCAANQPLDQPLHDLGSLGFRPPFLHITLTLLSIIIQLPRRSGVLLFFTCMVPCRVIIITSSDVWSWIPGMQL